MSQFIHIPEKCDDYSGYKKGELKQDLDYKCGEYIWKKEEKIRKNVKCYDDAHTKQFCISEQRIHELGDQVLELLSDRENQCCKETKENVTTCLKSRTIYDCQSEIDSFKECVDNTVNEGYEAICRAENMKNR